MFSGELRVRMVMDMTNEKKCNSGRAPGKWVVHLVAYPRLIVACQPPVAHMADNTDDLDRSGAHGGNPDMLANHILSTESMPGEIFVDDYYRLTALLIVFIEEASRKQRDAHYLEIVGSYGGAECERFLVGRERMGSGPIRHYVFAFAHRDDICQSDEFHAGHTPGAVDDVAPG